MTCMWRLAWATACTAASSAQRPGSLAVDETVILLTSPLHSYRNTC